MSNMHYYSPGTHRSAFRALSLLAEGEEPPTRMYGICNNVAQMMDADGYDAYRYCTDLLKDMGEDPEYPIGGREEYEETDDLWADWHGEARRDLARRMAVYIEEHLL